MTTKPRVLLTNDDGPPGKESPYIYGLSQLLKNELGWSVRVVVPSSQKSWIGKAFHIKEVVRGVYFYPKGPDGLGDTCANSRPLLPGEEDEWILLDATPATCVNIALFNLFPDEIDLVIAGPNLGRNSSAAFALSSGTIGAALSGALSGKRSIAVSYGTVIHPTPITFHSYAHRLTCSILLRLWSNWGNGIPGFPSQADLYNVNIPMVPALEKPGLETYWTYMWRNSYNRLFKTLDSVDSTSHAEIQTSPGGPDSAMQQRVLLKPSKADVERQDNLLTFQFSPVFNSIINPPIESLPKGCDAWALAQGAASVTPLIASFAEPAAELPSLPPSGILEQWKWKL